MSAVVDTHICNMALDRIGSTDNIASLDERSNAGIKCKFWFPICRDKVLRDFPWNFSRRSVALQLVGGDAPPGWAYQYQYPADCLKARQVSTEGGIRLPWANLLPGQSLLQWLPPRIPFEVSGNEDGDDRLILTDLEDAYLVYTRRITNIDAWDETAKSALAWDLANELVVPLSLDPKRKQAAFAGYEMEIARATAQNYNESEQDPQPESPSISIRS